LTILSTPQHRDVVRIQLIAAATVKDWGHFHLEVSFPTALEEVDDPPPEILTEVTSSAEKQYGGKVRAGI